jgi:predicted TIM-barrel fold metal-dependent hydrolase
MLLAEAISWGTTDKIIWGTDWSGSMLRHKTEVEFLKTIQISEDLQQDYGYKPLTDEDRNKWAGLNLARIMNIDPNA